MFKIVLKEVLKKLLSKNQKNEHLVEIQDGNIFEEDPHVDEQEAG